MLASFKKRIDNEDEGFTLIELMVVVLIIAILLAIAIPTFLGARERAQDRAAQSDIRNALTAEKVFYTDVQTYTSNTSTIQSIEPSLVYSAGGSKTAVGLRTSSDSLAVCVDKVSAGGAKFSVIDIASGTGAGTYFAKQLCSETGGLDSAAAAPTAKPTNYKTGGW